MATTGSMILALRNRADTMLGKTTILLFFLSMFCSMIKVEVNTGIALIAYFFINKQMPSKYTLRAIQMKQFIAICIVTWILEIMWIAVWSNAYQQYSTPPSTTLRFAIVMVFINMCVKLFLCCLLVSYWSDPFFTSAEFAADEKKTNFFTDKMNHDVDPPKLQSADSAASQNGDSEHPPNVPVSSDNNIERAKSEPNKGYNMSAINVKDAQLRLNTDTDSNYLSYEDTNEIELGSNVVSDVPQ